MNGLTKSEVAQRIIRTQKKLRLEIRHSAGRYADFLADKLGTGDDFHVRAAFSFTPGAMPIDGRLFSRDGGAPVLPTHQINPGDILHVTDSLLGGSFTSWLVSTSSVQVEKLRS